MKKLFTIFTILLLLLSLTISAFATDDEQQKFQDHIINSNEDVKLDSLLELGLQDAINYAIKNSKDLRIQQLYLDNFKITYEQQIKEIKKFNDLPDVRIDNMPIIDRKLIESGYNMRMLKLNLQIAEWNVAIKENQIRYNVEKEYYELLQNQNELNIVKESLELAKKQYEQSKKMYELGTISNQYLLAAELALVQTQSTYDNINMGYELQKMNFNNTLNLPISQNINIIDDIEYTGHDKINLEESVSEALTNNAQINKSKENYELSKLKLDIVGIKFPINTYKNREQQIEVDMAAKGFEMAKVGIEMRVRSAYLSLTTSEKQIATYQLAVEKAQKSLDLAQISFELGQNTANDVNQSMIELMTSKTSLAKQIHAYNTALLDFKYSTGLGKTQIGGGY